MPIYKVTKAESPFNLDLAAAAIAGAVKAHGKVAVVGGGGTGKTSASALAQQRLMSEHRMPVAIFGADRYKHLPWSAQSAELVSDLSKFQGSRFIAEGTRVAYALRKGLKVDAVVHLTKLTPLAEGRNTIAVQVNTVLGEWMVENPEVPVFEI